MGNTCHRSQFSMSVLPERASPHPPSSESESISVHGAATGLAAAESVEKSIQRLIIRCDGASRDLSAAAQSLIDAATSSLAASKATARSLQRHRSLWFDKHMEELDAGAKLLTAAARIPVGSGMEDAELAASLEALLPLTSSSLSVYQSNYIGTPADGLSDLRAVLEAVTRLQVAVSAVTSVLSGPGVRWFKSGLTADAASHNVIRVDARDVLGEALRSLSVEDIDVRVTGMGASITSVSLAAPSVIEIRYEVNGTVAPAATEITIDVTTGEEVFPPTRIQAGRSVEGKVVKEYCIPGTSMVDGEHGTADSRIGMALSPQEDILVVSVMETGVLEVFAFPSMTLIRTIGGMGSGPGQFNDPYKLCFSPGGSLFVTDSGNDRVQEVTVTGEYIRSITDCTLFGPSSLAVHPSTRVLAVAGLSSPVRDASCVGLVVLFDLNSGLALHSIVPDDRPSLSWELLGIRFTPDLSHIAVPSRTGSIAMYSMEGAFVTESIVVPARAGYEPTVTDVHFATNGDILLAENAQCLYVLSADGGSVVRVINFNDASSGVIRGAVSCPMTLVVRNNGNVLLLSQFGTHIVEIA